jgi:hypothetical protein
MSEQRSPVSRTRDDLERLSEEDQLWLTERLVEYKDLLEFLHTN